MGLAGSQGRVCIVVTTATFQWKKCDICVDAGGKCGKLWEGKWLADGRKCGEFPALFEREATTMRDTPIYDLGVRVLIYQEDGEFCAHALELDLLGYGKTEDEAISELLEVIRCQISFARSKNDDSILHFPAPQKFYNRWEAAHAAALKNQVFPGKSKAMAMKATWVAIEKTSRATPKVRFEAMEPSCA